MSEVPNKDFRFLESGVIFPRSTFKLRVTRARIPCTFHAVSFLFLRPVRRALENLPVFHTFSVCVRSGAAGLLPVRLQFSNV
jgi:hypothetical protein